MSTRGFRISFLSAIGGCVAMGCGSGSNDSDPQVVSCAADGVCESLCSTDPDCPPGATGGVGGDPGGGLGGIETGGTTPGAGGGVTGSGGSITGSGGAVTGSGGATTECTNIRPTGTDWDEATCDQWASETSECDAAWMIDNHYCDESCGRCATTGSGGAATGSGGAATGLGGAATGSGGAATGSGGGGTVDCGAPMPTGGTDHCGSNTQGEAGGLSWSLWSNAINSNSCITTYDTTAFSARWVESGDFLARIGLEWGGWGETPQPYTAYGTLRAEFSYRKTGTGGGFSYIGMYGWSNDPCVEWYIVEDSYNTFPFNPWQATETGSATIDGEQYRFYRNTTQGTGGSRCSGVTTWDQFWSVRQSARQCGTISLTEHFGGWTAAGMQLGSMLEAKILVEVGGGSGSIEFPVANVTAQ